MIDTNAVINPIILINEAVSQMAVSIQNNMNHKRTPTIISRIRK